jgi:hypothetical protein
MTNAQMIAKIRQSQICLYAHLAAATAIAEKAEKIAPRMRRYAVPYTVQPLLEQAYARAANAH